MQISFTKNALKDYEKLPLPLKKKADKQFNMLVTDINYPSLRTKKMQGENNIWEARIDYHYRFTFQVTDQLITIRSIGQHDKGLGKK
jgi:mRNA-degrading endonuclease RelE of RelBE toxin-antitoxin system